MLSEYRHHIWLHIIVFLFGFTAILGKLITLDAIVLVWYRVLIAFSAIGLYLFFRKERIVLSTDGLVKTMLTGLITAAHWICFFESIKRSNVSVALICLSTTTFFTAFIEPAFHKRKIRIYEVVFGLIVIVGIAFIFKVENQYKEGIFFGLASALLAALFSVINSVLIRKYNAKLISLWELVGGFLGVSVYLLLVQHTGSLALSLSDLIYLLLLGIVCTAFAYVVSVEVMKYLTPFTVNISINLEPVYGILLALLIFGESEQMSPGFYAGALVILAVIFTNAIFKRRYRKKTENVRS